MTDERKPQVGEKLLTVDEDGDAIEYEIKEVGPLMKDGWQVSTGGDNWFFVYWDDGDQMWTDVDADFSAYNDADD
jgi:hypothetical protein